MNVIKPLRLVFVREAESERNQAGTSMSLTKLNRFRGEIRRS